MDEDSWGLRRGVTMPSGWARHARQPPDGVPPNVWRAACAIAAEAHPNAIYPQPGDVKQARMILTAALGLEHG